MLRRKIQSRKEPCVIDRHVHGNADVQSLTFDARSNESGINGSDSSQKIPFFHGNSYILESGDNRGKFKKYSVAR